MLNGITTPAVPTAAFPPLSPEKQKKADEVKSILQQTLDSLKNGKSDINAQRKSAAAARVAQLKQAMQSLRQMPGMDPKAMARMVAMLAKQLAQAVKDYKAAGGTDSSVSASSSSGQVSASADPAASDQSTDTVDNTQVADVEVAPQELQITENKNEKTASLQQQGINAYAKAQNRDSNNFAAKRNPDKDQDDAFIRDVTSILGQMKGLLEAQRQRIKNEKRTSMAMDPDFRDVRIGEKALDEVEKTIRAIQIQGFSF